MSDADHKHDTDASKTGTDGAAIIWHAGDQPFSPVFEDHFYSKADGRAECGHVFISANRLEERWQAGGPFRIGELGFGTGLNFCETWRQWKGQRQENARLEFISFELHPMSASDIDRALSRWPEINAERTALLRKWPNTSSEQMTFDLDDQTRLKILCGNALDSLSGIAIEIDAWFLDGFTPARNPDMWSAELMQAVYDHTAPGGTFGTYTAAGFVRRNLAAAGFDVEKRPGFAGKREMLGGARPPKT